MVEFMPGIVVLYIAGPGPRGIIEWESDDVTWYYWLSAVSSVRFREVVTYGLSQTQGAECAYEQRCEEHIVPSQTVLYL